MFFVCEAFVAKVVGVIFWIATGINFYNLLPNSSLKYIFCIIPNSGLVFIFQIIFQFERSGKSSILMINS
jgi:hypothetical protein